MLRFDSPWQTDTSISIKSWGYVEHDEYRTPKSLIDELIDVVSKNDTDRTTALVGFVRENGEGTSHLVADVQNKFCALTLSSLDAADFSGFVAAVDGNWKGGKYGRGLECTAHDAGRLGNGPHTD
jgi:hypothetical protein